MNGWNKKGTAAWLALVASTFALPMTGCGDPDVGESVVPNVEAVVFVSRAFETEDGSHNVTGGNNQTIDYLRYTPGGGLMVLSPPTPDGELRDLTAEGGFEGVDVNGIDVSFDATQVVFSMRHADDNRYHVYVANLQGEPNIRQITFGDYHDVKPIFIPGDRIAFVTNQPYTEMGTRADEYNHSRVVTQIATVSIAAGDADRRLCSQNLSHSATPFLLSDGTIGFSRWEHLGPVNDVKLFRMNPDCTNMVAIAGQFGKSFNSIVQAQEIEPGVFVTVATSRRGTIQAGAVMEVDARSRTSTDPDLYIDVQQARFTSLTPQVPTGEDSPPSGVGRYRNPRPLPGASDVQSYLVSWADGDVNERNELANTAPNFGIYMWDPETQERTLVYDDPNMWDLYAIPVVPRDEPPVITPTVDANPDPSEPAVIGSIDVTATSLNENVNGAQFDGVPLGDALGEAVQMRVIEGFSSEIGSVGQFGLTLHEGAAILGETPIYEDGSWRAAVPAYLPYHLQPIDRFGLAIRNQMLWIQAMPGETRTCGGCHASRSETVQPRMGPTTIAQQVGADMDTFRDIADRVELPWYGASSVENVQDVLDRNCASCHDGGASDPYAGRFYTVNVTTMEGEELEYQIPYLDLSDRLIEAYYENEVVSYPASYVSLLYPSAMMGDSMATGDVPPEWIIPGSARGSRVIEVMNTWAEGDTGDLAWADRPLHPEDQGVDVSREDREALIRAADLGGQYYSRRNNPGGFTPMPTEY
ncbi:MAG TPA: hypothetical protein RMH99_31015 [Sandaracinaceae bacterium LLY-WYZ-13_1]|nr:hypothetical protein [Sandaracinaceae bacterium LLY-WYZ-13_1]